MMKPNTRYLAPLLAAIALSIALPANAEAFMGADESTRANCQRYRDNTTKAKEDELKLYVPKPANEYFSSGTCLDTIMNTRINIFTMGSLSGILDRVMSMASNRACGAVMGTWNQAVGAANGTLGTNVSVPYVGAVGGTSVGSGFGGSPVTVNGQSAGTSLTSTTQPVQQTQSQSVLDSAASKIKNIFK